MIDERRIITFGLTDEQNEIVRRCFPANNYELLDTDTPTDLIAISAAVSIIDSEKLDDDSTEMLLDFYEEVKRTVNETIVWLGNRLPPRELQGILKCYAGFADIEQKLKYIFLSAHNRAHKSSEFRKNIFYALKILTEIRMHPGISTSTLSEICEISSRNVQGYIEMLRCIGEWIEYDTKIKGWKLFDGKSVLFSDYELMDVGNAGTKHFINLRHHIILIQIITK